MRQAPTMESSLRAKASPDRRPHLVAESYAKLSFSRLVSSLLSASPAGLITKRNAQYDRLDQAGAFVVIILHFCHNIVDSAGILQCQPPSQRVSQHLARQIAND